jgi:hypothetical protein
VDAKGAKIPVNPEPIPPSFIATEYRNVFGHPEMFPGPLHLQFELFDIPGFNAF